MTLIAHGVNEVKMIARRIIEIAVGMELKVNED